VVRRLKGDTSKDVFPSLPELLEVALICAIGNVSPGDEDGEFVHPDATDVNDLACTQFEPSRLTAPKTTKSPFCPAPAPPALILSIYYQNPGCADGRRPELVSLPLSLDYIRWDIKDQKFLYRLDKRPDGRMRASALISAYCRRRCLDERGCSGSLYLKSHLETSRSHPSTASCHQFSPLPSRNWK
jgi:hypothetical protein